MTDFAQAHGPVVDRLPLAVESEGPRHRAVPVAPRVATERLGFVFPLLLVWLWIEFARPSNSFKIPMLISLISFAAYLVRPNKQWTAQGWAFLVLIAGAGAMVPLAANNYWAYQGAFGFVVLFLAICLPLQSLLTSVRRLQLWVGTLLAVITYVAGYAAMNGGYGPSGASGAQDENYVAAFIGMTLPFAYFGAFIDKRWSRRALLLGIIAIFMAAMVAQQNPSRGGFLGLVAVVLYCLWRSPKRLVGFGVVGLIAVVMGLLAGPAYWEEISTSTDYSSGTADIRLEFWKIGFRMFQAFPVLGVGPWNYRWVADTYLTAEQMVKFGRPVNGTMVAHSTVVELFAELGIVGVLAVAFLAWWTWVQLSRVQRATSNLGTASPVARDLTALGLYADAVKASLIALFVNGVFLSFLYSSSIWLIFAVGGAIPHIYRRRIASLQPAPHRPGPRRTPPHRTALRARSPAGAPFR